MRYCCARFRQKSRRIRQKLPTNLPQPREKDEKLQLIAHFLLARMFLHTRVTIVPRRVEKRRQAAERVEKDVRFHANLGVHVSIVLARPRKNRSHTLVAPLTSVGPVFLAIVVVWFLVKVVVDSLVVGV